MRTGTVQVVRSKRICTTKDCDRAHFAKGLCQMHYERQWRTINPGRTTEYCRRWESTHIEQNRACKRRTHQRYRQWVIGQLGGKCVDCGASEALELSHPNGDGGQHRKRMTTGNQYHWLYRHPEDLALVDLRCHDDHIAYDRKLRSGNQLELPVS